MALERFDGISGAARIITARRREQGAERHLVGAYQQNEKRPHQLSLGTPPMLPSGEMAPVLGSFVRHRRSCVIIWSMSAPSEPKLAR